MLDAIDSAAGDAAKRSPQSDGRRRGHPGGSMAAKARTRLAADGVEIDDPARPIEGRRRKSAKEPPPTQARNSRTGTAARVGAFKCCQSKATKLHGL